MAEYYTDITNYEDIADAIRAKNGEATLYRPGEMAQAILDIPTGSQIQDFSAQIVTNESENADLFGGVIGDYGADCLKKIAQLFSGSGLAYSEKNGIGILHFSDDDTTGLCTDVNMSDSTRIYMYVNEVKKTDSYGGYIFSSCYYFKSENGIVITDESGNNKSNGVTMDKSTAGNTIVAKFNYIYKSGSTTNYYESGAADANISNLPVYDNKYYMIGYPIIVNGSYTDPEIALSTFYNLANKAMSGQLKFSNSEVEGIRLNNGSTIKDYLNVCRYKNQ